MRFAVLFSDSGGNCVYVETESTRLLIDAGSNMKAIKTALASCGRGLEDIQAVLVTHDHSDHVSALDVLEKHHGVPVYATDLTCGAVCRRFSKNEACDWDWCIFAAGDGFEIGDIGIEPFAVPHDAADPVGFTISAEGSKLGVATDLGEAPMMVREHLRDCDALLLEFNHDCEMLRESGRPYSLIQRISGRSGHLSNDQAHDVLCDVATERLRHLVPFHISHDCNTPHVALNSAKEALARRGLSGTVEIHLPPYPTGLIDLAK